MNYYFNSTIFKKTLSGITGLFLVTFLSGHLAGNLQLLISDTAIAELQFNKYAKFMTTNPAVKLLSYLTYFSILSHSVLTVYLTIKSKQARPIQYAVNPKKNNSSWASRNMAILGSFIVLFLVIHLKSFWYEMHFGDIGTDSIGNKNLYAVTTEAFKNLWYVLFYLISMFMLSFHLQHGLESGFQTLGLKTKKYEKIIKYSSKTLAVIIPILFAIIPIYLYVR